MSFIFDFSIILHRMLLDIHITIITQITTIPMNIAISIRINPIVVILIGEELIHKFILFSFHFEISFLLLFFQLLLLSGFCFLGFNCQNLVRWFIRLCDRHITPFPR